jgi:hypothetical protein
MAIATQAPMMARAGSYGVRDEIVNPNRQTAVLVGALFLISTATFIVSNALITPILGSHNYVANVADHSHVMIAAALIALVEGTATFGIAIALYPTVKRHHPALALGFAGMRIAELVIATVFALSALLLVTASATAAHGPTAEALANLLVGLRHWTLMLIYVYTAIGGLMLTFMLFKTRLVPRGLSVLGLIGYPALLLVAVLDMLGVVDTVAGVGLVGLVPGGLFEFLLPLWLFAQGFNVAAVDGIRHRASV